VAFSGRLDPDPASVQEATSTASTTEAKDIYARFSENESPATVRRRKEGGEKRGTAAARSSQTVGTSRNSVDEEDERESGGFISGRRREELNLDVCDHSENVLERRETETGGSDGVDRLVDSLCEYSLAISAAVPSKEMALAEFQWRNGWFLLKVNALNDVPVCKILR
jgi:hypothetical protein